ncbi:MAG: NAD(P)H-hydrate epimerase [Planctomycetes bacterium]|nr:NAD(P)H-hydrate epimerase [Planctomycetota bacterium]
MRLRPLSRDEVREIDRRAIEQYGIPGVVLMENAGRGAAQWLAKLGTAGPVVICCGKGNNGGDGYVMARHLDAWGYPVRVVLFCDPAELKGDALINFRIIETSQIPILGRGSPLNEDQLVRALRDAAWIVDGLLGTGVQGEVRDPIRSAIETLNACPAPKFAIDIPSGLDSDTARPLGTAVRATHTATFVSTKLGFTNPEAAAYTGVVRVVEIGVPAVLLGEFAE